MTTQALHAQLLGGFRLTYGDRLVTNIEGLRLQSLLAYLMLHRDLAFGNRDAFRIGFRADVNHLRATVVIEMRESHENFLHFP